MDRLLNRAMLILGAYAFSIPVVSFIHELGHILAMRSIGITRYTLVINPLTESYASPWVSIPSEHLLFISMFGMIFQTIIFTVLGLILWRKRSVLLLPLMMCIPMTLINVGSYLSMGEIVEGSDVVLMANAGMPISLIKVTGLVFVLLGLWTYTRLLPVAGFNKSDPKREIFLPIVLGTGIYSLAMTIYGYMTGYGTMIGVINIISSLIMGLTLTLTLKKMPLIETIESSTLDSIKVLGIGVATVALCFII